MEAPGLSTKRRRLQCPLCKEKLSYSAYCRHQQFQSCIPVASSSNNNSDSDQELEEFNTHDTEEVAQNPSYVNFVSSSSSSSDENTDDLAPEIWDSDSDESVTEDSHYHTVNNVQFVLSYFLLFFQLCYHVSDRGLRHILSLVTSILYWASTIVNSNDNVTQQLASTFPKTLYSLKSQFSLRNELDRYCVCPSCHALYKEEDCIVTGPANTKTSFKCIYIEFPNHPQKARRTKKCGADLMKPIKVGKKYKLVPRKIFVYNSIRKTLQKFASRPSFFESCEVWRNFHTDGEFMTDIYDGKLWKEWEEYLTTPGNLLLMLNVDWFRPYKHTVYSVGVIYLAIQNLPRTLRFKPENVIIVGTIPGPHEPKLNMNTYLKPMVDELLELWKGTQVRAERSVFGSRTIRVALACTSSDIPATRKLCGFYGFKAKHGCSKCLKTFLTASFSDATDYSGFDRHDWPLRDMKVHREKAMQSNEAKTKCARDTIEREIGVRYSELLRIPYFDIVRGHQVDPMHNLFLGTAKNITSLWKQNNILSEPAFTAIQERVSLITVPAHVGRLPNKIASGFAGFTAEQWMFWTIVYSPFVLKDFLPVEHYEMWCDFSSACSLFCRPFIHKRELLKADELIIRFCKSFEDVFGKKYVTPNMHLHAHLRECIEYVGPVYSFWCFSFERYNGLLESFKKNWHAPELQLIEKFTLMQTLNAIDISKSTPPEFLPCLETIKKNYTMLEDSNRLFDSKSLLTYEKNIASLPVTVCALKLDCHKIIPPLHEKFLTEAARSNLESVYSILYTTEMTHIPLRYEEFSQMEVFGQVYTSKKSRSHSSTAIMALWTGLNGRIVNRSCTQEDIRTGQIEYFVLHVPDIAAVPKKPHIFAKVQWYEDHPRKNWLGNSIILSSTLFDTESESSFIPVSRIMSRCAIVEQSLTFDYGADNVNICLPLTRRIDE